MTKTGSRASSAPSTPKSDLPGSRRKPDRGSGRPVTPCPTTGSDPRVEAAKGWSAGGRKAARLAYSAAVAAGVSRDRAIAAGHAAGLAHELGSTSTREALGGLAAVAVEVFAARVVGVVPAGEVSEFEARCFERLFPDRGFPERSVAQ